MMKKINKEKGITLIALIVTIIVLLILAGITIGTLTGNNGIIYNANFASFSTKIRSYQEKVSLYVIKEEQKNKNESVDIDISDPEKIKEILENVDDEEAKKYAIQDNELKYMPDNVTNQEKEWLIKLEVSAYEEVNNNGTLIISTKVMSYANITGNVNLVYNIKAVSGGKEIYNKMVSTTHNKAGEKIITVDNVPEDVTLTIKSVYNSAGYDATSNQEQTVTIPKDSSSNVTFTYEYNNKNIRSTTPTSVLQYK